MKTFRQLCGCWRRIGGPHTPAAKAQPRGLVWIVFGLWAVGGLLSPVARAELPHPSFVYFGEVLDACGWPLCRTDRAVVIARLLRQGLYVECGRGLVDEGIGPAINYRVEVPLDDGPDQLYATYAARPGETILLFVQFNGHEYPVMDAQEVPQVGLPGGQILHNLCLGEDTDDDDLPDQWEEYLIWYSGGLLTDIADVIPGDDFDGDGFSNRQEYLAGTDPCWEVDFPFLDAVRWFSQVGKLGVAFYSVPGKTYRLHAAESLAAPDATTWRRQLITADADGEPVESYWRGDGYFTWLFFQPTAAATFYRLEVQ